MRTSKPASDMRSSISNLWLSAWFLMMATVRVGGEEGLDTISPGAWGGEEGADMSGRRREGMKGETASRVLTEVKGDEWGRQENV